ncbi:MAG: HK97 family phage prohead protease [Thermonemataceae bacterium]|nr:HK97 family phage prohead protease [Thermonemataceae bacterium]
MEIILSDESLNRQGTRVLTKGVSLENFKKNPVMFYNHDRERVIGRWENIRKTAEGTVLATPVFDVGDDFAKEIKRKYEEGFLKAASIGILVTAVSNDPDLMLNGQSWATITKSELLEASIVDIPANANAVKLHFESQQELALSFLGAKTEQQLSIKSELENFTQELKKILEQSKQEKQNSETELATKKLIEQRESQEQEQKVLVQKLNEKLAEFPERKLAEWWLKDAAFVVSLKKHCPEKLADLK